MVAEAIRLRGQIANDEAAKAATVSELNSLKEKNVALEAQVTTLESATANKDAELVSSSSQVAKMSQELSSLQLSRDELHTMAASLEVERDGLARQFPLLNDTCAELRNEVTSYKMFKEQIEKILSHGLKHVVMKCLRSSDYLDTLRNAIGHAIDKGMQDRLAAGIEHGKAGRSLENVEAYNPSAEADYVSTIAALQDGVVIGETSLSLTLDVPHSCVQRLKGEAAAKNLSISDAIVPLIKPLSIQNLVGEASTSGVPAAVMTTSLSTTFSQVSSVPSIPAVDADASKRPAEDRSSKIIFKEEELELH
ncbi:hypothetical protein Tco_1096871 [Tanacetum coccineum]